jgi:hypothetical protein
MSKRTHNEVTTSPDLEPVLKRLSTIESLLAISKPEPHVNVPSKEELLIANFMKDMSIKFKKRKNNLIEFVTKHIKDGRDIRLILLSRTLFNTDKQKFNHLIKNIHLIRVIKLINELNDLTQEAFDEIIQTSIYNCIDKNDTDLNHVYSVKFLNDSNFNNSIRNLSIKYNSTLKIHVNSDHYTSNTLSNIQNINKLNVYCHDEYNYLYSNLINNYLKNYINNHSITTITNLNEITNISINNSKKLLNIQNISNISNLDINYCESLRDISCIVNTYILKIKNCNSLYRLYSLSNVWSLYLSNCHNHLLLNNINSELIKIKECKNKIDINTVFSKSLVIYNYNNRIVLSNINVDLLVIFNCTDSVSIIHSKIKEVKYIGSQPNYSMSCINVITPYDEDSASQLRNYQ